MKYIYLVFLITVSTSTIFGQQPKKLFRSDSILEMTITLPLKDVINNRKERKEYNSKLSFTGDDGNIYNHNIKVKVRGKTRALKQLCTFPPLQLRFDKKETENSIFKGQKKIKLVTHCQSEKSFTDYIKREYLVYKMYQVVSPYSHNVRLCRITYVDENKPKQDKIHYGFLIESINHVAKRNDMTVYKGKIRNQETLQKENLDKLVFFQFLISNLDWSITERHNMKMIIGDKGALPIGVPYDFDYSGIINTPYALPPEALNLPDVRTRLFRGFCRSDRYEKTIEFYKSKKDDIYQVVNSASFLNNKSKNSMNKFITSFYDNLESEKYIDKKIVRACKVKHKHAYQYE